ncbi:MAG: hypothetical protein NTV88_00050 [Candidatus Micrarchaeota archaeon]|nr:hypothetical protein [Candidatus Micrarchaeota archaeon]
MAKKNGGMAQAIWKAAVWLATHFLHIFYLLTLLVIRAGSFLLKVLSTSAKKHHEGMQKPKIDAVFSPLAVQKTVSGDAQSFEQKVISSKSTVGIVLGARGSGKSALGMRFLENISAKTSRRAYAMGFDPSSLPAWITSVDDISQIPNNAFVLVDEGGISFSSRSSMSSANKILSSLLFVARHKGISALFISQNSSNIEVNAIRQADYLLLRKASLLQKDFERKIIAKIYDETEQDFKALPQEGRYSTYIYSDEFRGFVSNELPSFWSEKASKGYATKKIA